MIVALCVLYLSINSLLDVRIDDLLGDIVEFKQLYKIEGFDRVNGNRFFSYCL